MKSQTPQKKHFVLAALFYLVTYSNSYANVTEANIRKLDTAISKERAYVELLNQTKSKKIAEAKIQLKNAKTTKEKKKWKAKLVEAKSQDLSKDARAKIASFEAQKTKLLLRAEEEQKNKTSSMLEEEIKNAENKKIVDEVKAPINQPTPESNKAEKPSILDQAKIAEEKMKSEQDAQKLKKLNAQIASSKGYVELLDETKAKKIADLESQQNMANSPGQKEELEKELAKVKSEDLAKDARQQVDALEAKKKKLVADMSQGKPIEEKKDPVITEIKSAEILSSPIQDKDLTKNVLQSSLREDGEKSRERIMAILNDLQDVDKEESIKSLEYLGYRKVSEDEVYNSGETARKWMIHPGAVIHSYKVKPLGEVTVLQTGITTCIVKPDIKSELCLEIDGATKKCKKSKEATLCVQSKPIGDKEKIKFTRVVANEIASPTLGRQLPWPYKNPGFFKSFKMVSEDKSGTRPSRIYLFEFSICYYKIKITSPSKKAFYNDPWFYEKLGGEKVVGVHRSECKMFGPNDLKDFNLDAIESGNQSDYEQKLNLAKED